MGPRANRPDGVAGVTVDDALGGHDSKDMFFLLSLAHTWILGQEPEEDSALLNELVSRLVLSPQSTTEPRSMTLKVEAPVYYKRVYRKDVRAVYFALSSLKEQNGEADGFIQYYKGNLQLNLDDSSEFAGHEKESMDATEESDLKHGLREGAGDHHVMEGLVSRLLNSGNVTHAMKISSQFSHESPELILVQTALGLATRTKNVSDLPEKISQRIRSYVNLESLDNSVESVSRVLYALASVAEGARDFVKQIHINHEIAVILDITYHAVIAKDPEDLLQLLLAAGESHRRLCSEFIVRNHLEGKRVADVLVRALFRAMLQLKNRENSLLAVLYFNARASYSNQSHAASYISSEDESVGPVISDPKSALVGSPTRYGQKREMFQEGVDPLMSTAEFAEFASLCRDPREIGHLLTSLIHRPNLAHDVETELLVRAYFCFQLSCCADGVELVLRMIRDRVEKYVKSNQFVLLVRLLTGVGRFKELEYIIDTLIENDQFELILKKNVDAEGSAELKNSLAVYLRERRPSDHEKLEMVYYRFQMYRELGIEMQEQAENELSSLMPRITVDQAVLIPLLECMRKFVVAADAFHEDACFKLARECLKKADLIGAQVRNPNTRYIGLKESDIRQLMRVCGGFDDTLALAEAYSMNSLDEWSMVLFYQTITLGNFDIFEEYRRRLPLVGELFERFREYYRTERDNYAVKHFKRVLAYCSEYSVLIDIAREFEFDDLLHSVAITLENSGIGAGSRGSGFNFSAKPSVL